MTAPDGASLFPFRRDYSGDTAASELAEAVAKVAEYVDLFTVELAVQQCQARLYLYRSGQPEGVTGERVAVQLERLRAVCLWARTVAEESEEARGG